MRSHILTAKEVKRILSKELGWSVDVVNLTEEGQIMVSQGNDVSDTSIEVLREDFTERFGEDKTDRIVEFLIRFFDGLKEITLPDLPDRILYYKDWDVYGDGNVQKSGMMEQSTINGDLWCCRSDYWYFFQYKLRLEYTEIQYITKVVMELRTGRLMENLPKYRHSDTVWSWNRLLNGIYDCVEIETWIPGIQKLFFTGMATGQDFPLPLYHTTNKHTRDHGHQEITVRETETQRTARVHHPDHTQWQLHHLLQGKQVHR